MTQKEKEFIQRELLLDIILESTRYTVEEGDDDPIRTEVIERYKALCKGGEVLEKSVVERGRARTVEEKRRAGEKIRVHIDGKVVWKPAEECEKVPTGPKGFHWKWKGPSTEVVDSGV
jgi:hypothetical protein